MINIKVSGSVYHMEMEIKGHAGYAEPGKDIVCAGVSAIAFTLCGYLLEVDAKARTEIDEKTGHMHIKTEENNSLIRNAFEMAEVGLAQIAQAYPEHVTIEKFF